MRASAEKTVGSAPKDLPLSRLPSIFIDAALPHVTAPDLRQEIADNPRLAERLGRLVMDNLGVEAFVPGTINSRDWQTYERLADNFSAIQRNAGLIVLSPAFADAVHGEQAQAIRQTLDLDDIRFALSHRELAPAGRPDRTDFSRLEEMAGIIGAQVIANWAEAVPPALKQRVLLLVEAHGHDINPAQRFTAQQSEAILQVAQTRNLPFADATVAKLGVRHG